MFTLSFHAAGCLPDSENYPMEFETVDAVLDEVERIIMDDEDSFVQWNEVKAALLGGESIIIDPWPTREHNTYRIVVDVE